MSPLRRPFVPALVALLTVVACSSEKGDATPVAIGVVASLTGDVGSLGSDAVDAMNLAVAEINAGGGVLGGRPLKLHSIDDGTTIDGAKSAYATLVASPVPVILGPLFSGGVTANEQALKDGRVLTISPSASSPTLTSMDDGGVFFRTVPSDTIQGVVLAQLVVEANLSALCVVQRDDAYGNGLADIAVETLAKSALSLTVVRAKFDPAATDLTHALDPCEAVKTPATGVSGIAFVTFVADGAALLDDATRRGFRPPQHRFFGVDGNHDTSLLSLVGDASALEGMRGTIAYAPDPATADGARGTAFEAQFTKAFGRPPSGASANAYDAVHIAALAIEIAGSASDRAKVLAAMAKVSSGDSFGPNEWQKATASVRANGAANYRGASGEVDFDLITGDLAPPYYIAVWSFTNGALVRDRVVTIGP